VHYESVEPALRMTGRMGGSAALVATFSSFMHLTAHNKYTVMLYCSASGSTTSRTKHY